MSLYIITLRIFFESAEGPLLEKIATIGAGLYLIIVAVGRIVPIGLLQISYMQKSNKIN